ncbi:response regulator [Jidongwangia harbinensis]|uniref:response regulator n=1 Tax=Jidongwangia harbinensis TaxID=2878561 RepID=UPI001CD99123|nr:response regulator [Jidongwangia harbinensis]MCA2213178.1 HDOD domain-containing protein [Jidongwangia harbinensis]
MSDRPHVLFVDDEPRILGGLRRMLRAYRDRWDMSFAEGGEAALAAMREQPCDVIVSDYRMPGMDGAELLERVRNDYPGTARVILSGQTNEDNLLHIMVLAHEFLTKPSSPEQLVATLDRLIGVRTDAADFVESLPSPPSALVELVQALDAEDASPASVGEIIERDPAATAKVLHLVNSSAYTAGRTVSNVSQAVVLLGLHTVRGLVLMHDLIRTFDVGGELPAGWIDGLTRHSVETSRLARLLAEGQDWESHAFTAGLLHEVGQLVLASSRPAAFRLVLDSWHAAADGSVDLCPTEQAAFGVSHLDVGAKLLGRWGLPAPVIEAVSGPAGPDRPAAVDATWAVSLAHGAVEAELGPVCGRCHGAVPDDADALDPPARDVLSRWRERLRR